MSRLMIRDKTKQVHWRREVLSHWHDGWTYPERIKAIKIFRDDNTLSFNLSKQSICNAFEWLIDNTIGEEDTQK